MNRGTKRGIFSIIALALPLALPVMAATLRSGDTFSLNEAVNDDAYIAGGQVTVGESVAQDAAVAGGQVVITGATGQDLMAVGGRMIISGPVGDDLRAAGGEVLISGSVTDDVVLGAGNVTVTNAVTIGGDLVVGAGTLVLDGTVNGNVKIAGGSVILNGTINGSLDVHADSLTINGAVNGPATLAATTITLQSGAKFGNSVAYWRQAGELDFGESLATGTARFAPELRWTGADKRPEKSGAEFLAGWTLFSLLSGIVILLLLVLFFRKSMEQAGERLQTSFWKHLGIGCLYLIVTPIVAILLMITVIGLPLGLTLLALYIISFYFAKMLTAVIMAIWLGKAWKKNWNKWAIFGVSILIFVVLKLLGLIPVLGWIIGLLAVAAGLGAFWSVKYTAYRKYEQ